MRDRITAYIAVLMGSAAIYLATLFFSGTANAETYALEATYVPSREVVVLDTGMSFLDCLEDKQERRKRWGSNVQFSCARERTN